MTPTSRAKAIARNLERAHRALASAKLLFDSRFADDAVSRAYYAALHAARAALASVGAQPKTHKGINQRFNLDLVIPGHVEAEYLSLLGRMQTRREQADYGTDAELSIEEARIELEAAHRFVNRMVAYLDTAALPPPPGE